MLLNTENFTFFKNNQHFLELLNVEDKVKYCELYKQYSEYKTDNVYISEIQLIFKNIYIGVLQIVENKDGEKQIVKCLINLNKSSSSSSLSVNSIAAPESFTEVREYLKNIYTKSKDKIDPFLDNVYSDYLTKHEIESNSCKKIFNFKKFF